ncbi:MAG: xylulose kinase [Candidatus Accumulibacter sp.]|nr:xylulose kinase [Accumulibacter sp.]
MSSDDRTTLGLDASTQSLSAVLLKIGTGEVLWQRSLAYRDDPRLLGFGFEHDTLVIPPREPGEAEQPPRLFVAALDAILADLASSGHDLARVAAINTSGQQHGHVYLDSDAATSFSGLRDAGSGGDALIARLGGVFAYGGAPIWKTANTVAEAEHIRAHAGGKAATIERTGSDMPLRFSAAAHRKIARRYPEAYAATRHILQISSLLPAILAGDCAIPVDFGNACGTGLMNYRARAWDDAMLNAVAHDLQGGPRALADKLPPIAHPLAVVGRIAVYFREKYGFSPDCAIVAGSGDNPQSKALASGDLLSLGTSFVYMISTPDGRVDADGAANAMYDALGRPFNIACRTNGALTWDRLRVLHGLGVKDHAVCEAALSALPPGSRLRFWHPDAESFPIIDANPDVVRLDDGPADFAGDHAGIVDSALGLVYRYGTKIAGGDARNDPIAVCGGPSASPGVMRRVAAIWNRPAILAGQAGAALGAAVSAAVALIPETCGVERDAAAASLRAAIYVDSTVIDPEPEWVRCYHAPGGFLDRLEAAFTRLRGSAAAKPASASENWNLERVLAGLEHQKSH